MKQQNILAQEKIKIVHDINLLKEKQKKDEENKIQYEFDIKLYERFKNEKSKNILFIIPEMFIKKYNIFQNLENENKLSLENFLAIYKPDKITTNYNDLFQESENSTFSDISEIYSDVDNNELLIATNQINTK